MTLNGLRSDFKTLREISDFGQAARFSIVKALGLTRTVEVTIHGTHVHIRPNSPDLHVAQKTLGDEFDDVLPLVLPLRHNLIVDAGAYIGTVSVILARAFPTATIVAIEPSQENFSVLKKNTIRYPNIIALNAALAPIEGYAPFFDHEGGPWGYSLLETTTYGSPSPKMLHEVQLVTIPQILQRFSASGIDLLKLDIEGAEKDLLANAPTWVSNTRVIAAELHDWIQDGCRDTFTEATSGRQEPRKSGELTISVA
jgi:FkbM family methyltransferase